MSNQFERLMITISACKQPAKAMELFTLTLQVSVISTPKCWLIIKGCAGFCQVSVFICLECWSAARLKAVAQLHSWLLVRPWAWTQTPACRHCTDIKLSDTHHHRPYKYFYLWLRNIVHRSSSKILTTFTVSRMTRIVSMGCGSINKLLTPTIQHSNPQCPVRN